MTPEKIERDRTAGTPGPWRVGPVDDTVVIAPDGSEVAAIDGDYNEPDLWPVMEANARRIARLPELEQAYLDLTAERDAALALVAEAYESAANVALHGKQARRESIAFDIAELTPADALAAQAARDERMRSEGAKEAEDYFGSLVAGARTAAAKAAIKFPQPNYVTLKIAEEAGEVVRGAVHYAEGRMEWSEVEGEITQLLAMLIRFVTEGDLVNGVIPPSRAALQENSDG